MNVRDENKSREELIREVEYLRSQVNRLRESISLNDYARKALSKSVETFRGLFEQASDTIFLLDPAGAEGPTIVDANRAACSTHGYSKSELIGSPISMLDTPETAKHIHERMEQMAQGKKLTFEGEHRRKDGTVFPVEVTAQLIRIAGKQYVLATDRDISERKSAMDRIRKERDRAQLFFDFAGVMLIVIHRDQTIEMINNKGCDILGYEKDEIVGKNWFDLCIPEQLREEVRRTFNTLMNGEIEPAEYYVNPVVTKTGEERLISWHNTILRDEHGDIMATLSSGEDITGKD